MKTPQPPRNRSSGNRELSNYRPGVGIVLLNKDGHVLISERLDNPGAWQMPQGGIDEGEEPETAVFREMEEEIGTRNATILGMLADWICYDFPPALGKKLWNGLRVLGTDADIKLDTHHEIEFAQWKWVPLKDLTKYAVPFKRAVYDKVVQEFSKYV
jgi:putative (di)nucleoside polyphosphate hydrolase